MTESVRPGVYFEHPPGIPRGPHQLSRDEVRHDQRQRILMAFTELLADRGYTNVRIVDVTKRAAVSNDSFYELFATKEDCACAAYGRFVKGIARLAAEAGLATSETWAQYIQASVEGYLGALIADPSSRVPFSWRWTASDRRPADGSRRRRGVRPRAPARPRNVCASRPAAQAPPAR